MNNMWRFLIHCMYQRPLDGESRDSALTNFVNFFISQSGCSQVQSLRATLFQSFSYSLICEGLLGGFLFLGTFCFDNAYWCKFRNLGMVSGLKKKRTLVTSLGFYLVLSSLNISNYMTN
jgi:hypothetical protein